MFERYTNGARRTVFFARFEASRFGSPYIETEHLLLGLLREDRSLRKRLPIGAAEQIRKRIEERVEQPVQSTATSVDLPLSRDCKRALHYAAEERARHWDTRISTAAIWLLASCILNRPQPCSGISGSSTPAIARWWRSRLRLLRWKAPLRCPRASLPARWGRPPRICNACWGSPASSWTRVRSA